MKIYSKNGLASVAALSVLASASMAQDVDITIGWVPPDITGVFKTATDFFELSAEQANLNGFNVTVLTKSATSSTAFAEQAGIIEDMVQRRVDVIAVSPSEVDVVRPALKLAEERGIPVIVVNLLAPISGLNVNSYIGFDNAQGAAVSAYAVADYFGGPGVLGTGRAVNVEPGEYLDLEFWQNLYGDLSDEELAEITGAGAIIEGTAGGFYSTTRLNGFTEVIDLFPGLEIVGTTCAGNWNRERGSRCAEDILQSNPDGLDFIWAASNEMGLGAMLVSDSAGRLETTEQGAVAGDKNVAIFTNDVTPESVDRIAEGKMIAETTHGFADWGWFGAQFAVQLACGQDVPASYDIRPRTVFQSNARTFYPDPKLPEIDWASIRENCNS